MAFRDSNRLDEIQSNKKESNTYEKTRQTFVIVSRTRTIYISILISTYIRM